MRDFFYMFVIGFLLIVAYEPERAAYPVAKFIQALNVELNKEKCNDH